jgi:hypothetical protein
MLIHPKLFCLQMQGIVTGRLRWGVFSGRFRGARAIGEAGKRRVLIQKVLYRCRPL